MNAEQLGLVEETVYPMPTTAAAKQELYWTPAKLAQAKPVPMPVMTVAQHQVIARKIARLVESKHSKAKTVPAVFPGRYRSTASNSTRKTNLVADTRKYPYSVVGKLFMSIMGTPASYQGTAWIIGKQCILTAGHCVYDRQYRQYYNNFQFIPQFKNGATPFGTWSVTKVVTLKEYTNLNNGEELIYDIGACILDKPLPMELGIAGYTMSQPVPMGKLRSIGYPAEPTGNFAFDGQRLWESVGDYNDESDPGVGTNEARNYAMYCDLTGGCSGGPMFSTNDRPVAVGLNSHVRLVSAGGRQEQPPRMFSPYFGDALSRIIQWLKINGGEPNDHDTDEIEDGQPDNTNAEVKSGLVRVVENLNTLIGKL